MLKALSHMIWEMFHCYQNVRYVYTPFELAKKKSGLLASVSCDGTPTSDYIITQACGKRGLLCKNVFCLSGAALTVLPTVAQSVSGKAFSISFRTNALEQFEKISSHHSSTGINKLPH